MNAEPVVVLRRTAGGHKATDLDCLVAERVNKFETVGCSHLVCSRGFDEAASGGRDPRLRGYVGYRVGLADAL